jgi:hypothetical protein
MGEREISLPFGELSRLELYCDHCGTGFLIDFSNRKATPTACSACNRQFCTATNSAISAFERFFFEASQSKMRLQFRVKAP